MASTYLTRTPASAGNRKTFTISFWLKRSDLNYFYFSGGSGSGVYFDSSNRVEYFEYSGGYIAQLTTNYQFKDLSSWYHVVITYNSTEATASDRIKIWINGVQQTSFAFSTYPSLNYDSLSFNTTSAHTISYPNYLNGYLAHYHFIDGTAYDASAFGETDATTGIWKPKTAPSVTYGTNGFFLKFENSGSMGTDSSPNVNNFTVNGTMTQTVDTPSNVFATFNVLVPSNNQLTLKNGNLFVYDNSNNLWASTPATLGATSGKWYWEFKDENAWGTTSDSTRRYGICDLNTIPSTLGTSADARYSDTTSAYAYMNTSGVRYNGSTIAGTTSTYPTFSPTDIIQVAMDLDNYKLYFGKNGTWLNSSDPANGTNPVATLSSTATWSPYVETKYGSDRVSANFGNGYFGTTAVASAGSNGNGAIFEYDVPTGYYALNTKNINEQEYD